MHRKFLYELSSVYIFSAREWGADALRLAFKWRLLYYIELTITIEDILRVAFLNLNS